MHSLNYLVLPVKTAALVLAILLKLTFPGIIYGENNVVQISGKAPGYAGEEIVFYRWTDFISFTEKEMVRFVVNENDEFSVEFIACQQPVYIFSNSGRYFLYMYVQGGKEYHVILPPMSERAPHEKMNPYFEGIPTHIAVINNDDTELNELVRVFDELFDPLIGVSLVEQSVDQVSSFLDSVSLELARHFEGVDNAYFSNYVKYKTGLLESIGLIHSARYLSDNYFRHKPVLYDNVSYMELFNQVYNRYFLFFSRTIKGSRIFEDINRRKSLSSLMNTLQTDTVLGSGRLLELVVLKGIHDAFYGSDFSRSGLLNVLDSLAYRTDHPEHKQVASFIRAKITRQIPGFPAPGFSLKDREGNLKELSDYRGYYIYLNFCTAASYSCLAEYDVLSRLYDKHREYLRIITVFIDNDYHSMLNFLSKNEYDWDFLFYGNQPSLLKEYDVRMFPGYYLIDRDGTNLMFPAPSPAEDFERYLLRTMQSRGE